jgi:hypothetical protein
MGWNLDFAQGRLRDAQIVKNLTSNDWSKGCWDHFDYKQKNDFFLESLKKLKSRNHGLL